MAKPTKKQLKAKQMLDAVSTIAFAEGHASARLMAAHQKYVEAREFRVLAARDTASAINDAVAVLGK